jgi:hypothetical protein
VPNDVAQFYKHCPLPLAADPFAVDDVEKQLIDRLLKAGYAADEAPVKVRVLLRQLAVAWDVPLPPGEPYNGPMLGTPSQVFLEKRRAWCARDLAGYAVGDLVRWRDEDARWVPARVLAYTSDQLGHEAMLLFVISTGDHVYVTDHVRVQISD